MGTKTENYETPFWAVRRLLEELELPGGEWVEPCAGNGRIIAAINRDHVPVTWTAMDIRTECYPNLQAISKNGGLARLLPTGDFLTGKGFSYLNYWNGAPADVCMMNPPFSRAYEFLSKALSIARWVVMLQRLNWLGSGTRNGKNDFLRAIPPDVYVLPNRLLFLLDGEFPRHEAGHKLEGGKKSGDSIEYAWFVWPPVPEGRFREKGSLYNLADTPKDERAQEPTLTLA